MSAGRLTGVTWVDDPIELAVPTPSPDDVKLDIKKAMELDPKKISVETYDGTIRPSRRDASWAEHDATVSAAWAAPGVTGPMTSCR